MAAGYGAAAARASRLARNCVICVTCYLFEMRHVVTATEAARSLGDLLARVRYRQESFLIRRGREIVARLSPPSTAVARGADLARIWSKLPHLAPAEAEALDRDLADARKTVRRRPRNPWAR